MQYGKVLVMWQRPWPWSVEGKSIGWRPTRHSTAQAWHTRPNLEREDEVPLLLPLLLLPELLDPLEPLPLPLPLPLVDVFLSELGERDASRPPPPPLPAIA